MTGVQTCALPISVDKQLVGLIIDEVGKALGHLSAPPKAPEAGAFPVSIFGLAVVQEQEIPLIDPELLLTTKEREELGKILSHY